jgi:hypothetical protein
MKQNKERDRQIVALLDGGVPIQEVGLRFDLSDEAVKRVQREAREAQERMRRAEKAQKEIRRANDIDRQWPVEMIVEAMGITDVLADKAFDRLLRSTGRPEISLRNMMDLLMIAPRPVMNESWDFMPSLFRQRGLGSKTYVRLLAAPAKVNFGTAFRREWNDRRRKVGAWLKLRHRDGPICCLMNCGILPPIFD